MASSSIKSMPGKYEAASAHLKTSVSRTSNDDQPTQRLSALSPAGNLGKEVLEKNTRFSL